MAIFSESKAFDLYPIAIDGLPLASASRPRAIAFAFVAIESPPIAIA